MVPDKASLDDFIDNPKKYIWGSFDPNDHPDNKEKSLKYVTDDMTKKKPKESK